MGQPSGNLRIAVETGEEISSSSANVALPSRSEDLVPGKFAVEEQTSHQIEDSCLERENSSDMPPSIGESTFCNHS